MYCANIGMQYISKKYWCIIAAKYRSRSASDNSCYSSRNRDKYCSGQKTDIEKCMAYTL